MSDGKLERAFERIDAANAEDPREEEVDGEAVPKEWIYGRRMSATLDAFRPDAPEPVKLAARAQHIQRWKIPRDEYPMDRKGFLRWRQTLYGMHADLAAAICEEVGYDAETIAKVRKLLRKKGLKSDPDVQLLEDVICLVFLEHYFAAFAAEHEEEKVISILQKTWRKMSEAGQRAALALELGPERALVEKALAG